MPHASKGESRLGGLVCLWWQILARTSQAVYTQLQAVRRQVCSPTRQRTSVPMYVCV